MMGDLYLLFKITEVNDVSFVIMKICIPTICIKPTSILLTPVIHMITPNVMLEDW